MTVQTQKMSTGTEARASDGPGGWRRAGRWLSTLVVGALLATGAVTASPVQAAAGTDRLHPGEVLRSGEHLQSSDGRFVLRMQSDGNLVEYAPGNVPIWDTRTAGHPGAYLSNQTDGNLVVYGPGPLWASGTAGKPAGVLVLQNDGNLVLYAPGNVSTWANGANTAQSSALPLPRASVTHAQLGARHHDYPALDLSVPTGTPYYAVRSGRVSYTSTGNACGVGIIVSGDDGVQYTYCHGSSRAVASGSHVAAGAFLGRTGNTGASSGPHLHLQLRYSGLRCPQTMMQAIYAGTPVPDPKTLPTSGCSY